MDPSRVPKEWRHCIVEPSELFHAETIYFNDAAHRSLMGSLRIDSTGFDNEDDVPYWFSPHDYTDGNAYPKPPDECMYTTQQFAPGVPLPDRWLTGFFIMTKAFPLPEGVEAQQLPVGVPFHPSSFGGGLESFILFLCNFYPSLLLRDYDYLCDCHEIDCWFSVIREFPHSLSTSVSPHAASSDESPCPS